MKVRGSLFLALKSGGLKIADPQLPNSAQPRHCV